MPNPKLMPVIAENSTAAESVIPPVSGATPPIRGAKERKIPADIQTKRKLSRFFILWLKNSPITNETNNPRKFIATKGLSWSKLSKPMSLIRNLNEYRYQMKALAIRIVFVSKAFLLVPSNRPIPAIRIPYQNNKKCLSCLSILILQNINFNLRGFGTKVLSFCSQMHFHTNSNDQNQPEVFLSQGLTVIIGLITKNTNSPVCLLMKTS